MDWASGRLGLRRGRIARTVRAVSVRGWRWRRRPAGTCASSATSHIFPDPELPLLLHPAMPKGSNAALERMQKRKPCARNWPVISVRAEGFQCSEKKLLQPKTEHGSRGTDSHFNHGCQGFQMSHPPVSHDDTRDTRRQLPATRQFSRGYKRHPRRNISHPRAA